MAAKLAATKADDIAQTIGDLREQTDFPEQFQEQIVVAVQEPFRKSGECNDNAEDIGQQEYKSAINNDCCEEDIRQQEYESTINDGCEEDDDSKDELELLLKKAEESLRTNQSAKNDSKVWNEFSLPSLNVGVSIDEQLYIKRHPGAFVTLRQDEVSQDNSSKKHITSNKIVLSSPKTASTTDDNGQDSYAKLSKKEKQKIRESTTGPGWFDMKKPEITPEIKRDLQIIKLRNVLDPKRFYKKDDSKGLPKYFEIGTIKEGPAEFYSSRIPRKERKQTIADELLANEQSRRYFKRKFTEIQEIKQSGGKKYYKQLKAKRRPNWEKNF
ncbi:deoxynucleotidyltransferase terminal-interacting protein 2-like [Rhizophagus clarus]|nr:deoxynucleotidyltransferase terminal-interacting protein 2-like [Rhizophagus clarus]